ncbi:MAG: acetone carboxylase subunit gamma [Chloroflexota bacterium]|nr:MAG: acetone carboxylase subunit gamma [Chloroflexota bacterium]
MSEERRISEATTVSYPKEVLSRLIDGELVWDSLKPIISGAKDGDRFDKVTEILQERMPWQERILLPLSYDLYIVEKDGERIVKCACGHEFGDYRENWKLNALIHVRDSDEAVKEIYPVILRPDSQYCEIREFYCPGCGTQLEVETVPAGYPIIFDFLPDLDAFYEEWLGQPLATKKEFTDLSDRVIEKWGT